MTSPCLRRNPIPIENKSSHHYRIAANVRSRLRKSYIYLMLLFVINDCWYIARVLVTFYISILLITTMLVQLNYYYVTLLHRDFVERGFSFLRVHINWIYLSHLQSLDVHKCTNADRNSPKLDLKNDLLIMNLIYNHFGNKCNQRKHIESLTIDSKIVIGGRLRFGRKCGLKK